jgi:UMF1 family MFS transporter
VERTLMAVTDDTAAAPVSTRRERTGWYFYDWANSAFSATVITVFLGPFLTSVTKQAAGCALGSDCTGDVHPLGITVAAGSYYPYLVSLSVFLTVFVLPVMGAIADRTPRKKPLLAATAFLAAGATIAMAFVTGERYLLGGLLFLIANISGGASIVVYNSFLPQLAGPDDRDKVSSRGWAIGYLGGGLLLLFNLVAVSMLSVDGDPQRTLDLARWCIVSAGVWWGGFTLVPLFALREHPGRESAVERGNVLLDGFRQLGHTIRAIRAYPLTVFFLLAYLIYNDGIQTVISLASQYGTEELKLTQSTLIVTILLVQFLAFGGALLLGWLATRIGARKTIVFSLALWLFVVVAAFWLPAGKPVPFMILGVAIGLVLGGSQALSRSLFSQLIPAGREGEYYGFYEISDKGTSWLGPLAFGLVFQLTASYRLGILSLIVFFVVGGVLLAFVPVRRAVIAAGNTPPRLL